MMPPLGGGSCPNIAILFGTEKMLDGKKSEYMFIHFDTIREHDRQTDRHYTTA